MKKTSVVTVMICLVLALSMKPLRAQGPGGEQEDEHFERWVDTVADFVQNETFNEADLQSFLSHWGEFSNILGEEEEEGVMLDIEGILADPQFQAWAGEAGVDGKTWLRKSMRVVAVFMRDQYLRAMKQAEASFPQQLEMIEQQRSQIGEESYQQMKKMMEEAAQRSKQSQQTIQRLPGPTSAEQTLLEKYHDQLISLMQGDEDEGEEEW